MKEIIVLLDNVRSALNVGAIFRTCDGAGVAKLYLSGITPYPPHPKVVKTALGAQNLVDFEYIKEPRKFISDLKLNGYQLVSIEQTVESLSLKDYSFKEKTLLIFGNEITGVNPELLELTDVSLELPMLGKKRSLNVATTVGIVLYNIRLRE